MMASMRQRSVLVLSFLYYLRVSLCGAPLCHRYASLVSIVISVLMQAPCINTLDLYGRSAGLCTARGSDSRPGEIRTPGVRILSGSPLCLSLLAPLLV